MKDNKMTDDRVIEGLTRWAKSFDGIATDLVWLTAAIDLINRQKVEIERLQKAPKCLYEYDGEAIEHCSLSPCYNYTGAEEVRAEAIKEFAHNLIEHYFHDLERDSLFEEDITHFLEREIRTNDTYIGRSDNPSD